MWAAGKCDRQADESGNDSGDKEYDERQAQEDKRRMKAETRKVQSWGRVGKERDERATSKSDDFREKRSACGPDTCNAPDSGEQGPTALEGTSMQGKRLQVFCEIGEVK